MLSISMPVGIIIGVQRGVYSCLRVRNGLLRCRTRFLKVRCSVQRYKIVERQGRRVLYEFDCESKEQAEEMYSRYMALCGAVLIRPIEAEPGVES